MRRIQKDASIIFLVLTFFVFSSCALSSAVTDSVSTSLSGSSKRGVPVKKGTSGKDPMLAITGETDVTLVSDFFPTALMMYQILHQQNPNHLGLTVMTGSLNVMYANAFVQTPADSLPPDQFDMQNAEYERAKMHYLRGRDLCLEFLEGRHKGFKKAVFSGDEEECAEAMAKLDKNDVDAAYWAGAGWLGAFSLDPLNPDMLGSLSVPAQLLEKAAALNPDYSDGAIWDVLFNFYVSAPSDFGGNYERGMYCHEQAMRVSGANTPGPYITYAQAVCQPSGDEKGFVDSLNKALSINPDDNPSSRLMTTIMQKKARFLKDHESDYFLKW